MNGITRRVGLALLALAPMLPAQEPPERAASRPVSRPTGLHAAFDRILRENVRNERVDYLNVRAEHREALREYLDRLATTDPKELGREARLAFYINLYNATMIEAVIDRYEPGWTPAADDFTVFEAPLVRLSSGRFSLNHLENEIIREQFEEPRIHVALVCGARSCPPLLPRAYLAHDLDEVLEAKMKRFLHDSFRNVIDHEEEELRLSRIFDWYAVDFGGPEGVPQYVDRYTEKDVADYEVSFLEYSWKLNITPPRKKDK